MIRVTVELLPFGSEKHKKHLGTAFISNDGTGTEKVGNYRVTLSKWSSPEQPWRKGTVAGFLRLARGPWDLLYLALKDIVGERN